MSIATKNGSVIVKNGSIGTECGCCGDWYCCPSIACSYEKITGVTATVNIAPFLLQTHTLPGQCFLGHIYRSVAVSGISGAFTLTPSQGGRQWSRAASDCRDVDIMFEHTANIVNGVAQHWVSGGITFREFAFTAENSAIYKTASDMSCESAVTGSRATYDFGQYQADGTLQCSSVTVRTLSAAAVVGECGVIPQTIQSGVVAVALGGGCPGGYSFDENCGPRTVEIVSQIGGTPGELVFLTTQASVRFDIEAS